ncbi:probable jasmonic acid carboxyl methyltransferase 2 [Musa acuminata AAA Group]|uniref:probable jasmonic acid carboxyl methyltransferase 2 n=1 Tax=Musa acuminata AAA Group TaxID=214697 RepID=UPI0031D6692F
MAKPILEEAIGGVYMSLLPERMAVVDLGCSSGPNTLEVVSEVLDVIGKLRRSLGRQEMPEILFFLNDLPGNDFNHVFRSLGDYKRKVEEEKGKLLVPYYVVGVPGSFYGRLFPCQSVHFFNASCCLNWLSQVPEGEQGVPLNNKNIYVSETSPLEVVKAYQDQHQRDLSGFLRCRHAELSYGARMVLSFLGRKGSYPPSGDVGYFYGLLAEALSALVSQFFLNDLPRNDFNHVFRSLGEYKRKVEQEKGNLLVPYTWWECRAPSTAGFSHVGASTSFIVLDLSTGSLRFLKDSTPNGVPHSTTRTSTLQRQAHRRL